MKKQNIVLTAEKMQEIHTSEKFRNEVAYAHGCADSKGNLTHYETCSYPERYTVTPEQIAEAKAEIAKSKAQKLAELGNKLVFVGMGTTYPPTNDVSNTRIRAEFQNPAGKNFFIEFCGTHISHAIDRDLQREYDSKLNEVSQERRKHAYHTPEYTALSKEVQKWLEQPYNNYNNLERASLEKYTKQNVLEFINKNFDCNFTEIEIDNYTLRTEDFICKSPLK